MNITFEKYIEDVKSQLTCNASDEYRNKNITYGYTYKDIDSNFEFFRVMLKCQISAYKALLYFSDYVGQNIKDKADILKGWEELAEQRKKDDEQMLNSLTYFIMFSGDYKDSYGGTIVAKKYHGIPSKQKEELCNIFGFRILSEEEFENIKAYKKIIL